MKTGYFIAVGRKAVFLETDATIKSKKVVFEMINAIGNYRGLCKETIERCQNDKPTYERIQREMQAATLEEKETPNVGKWYNIKGRNFGGGYDISEIIVA